MKRPILLFAALAMILTCAMETYAQEAPAIPASFYDKELIADILGNENCTGLRVYPTLDLKKAQLSLMIIGVDESGAELYNWTNPKLKYQLYEGITDGKADIEPLSANNARKLCQAYSTAHVAFNSVIAKDKISDCSGDCTGYSIRLTTKGTNFNFEIVPAKIVNNAVEIIGTPVAGDPCPTFCGDSGNYLCTP
ncbi:MAG: hypothetical protein HKN79_03460 [Flavobacteriales bacterium]|nr:hypothetical protein [Flavobacteriales bacterium]